MIFALKFFLKRAGKWQKWASKWTFKICVSLIKSQCELSVRSFYAKNGNNLNCKLVLQMSANEYSVIHETWVLNTVISCVYIYVLYAMHWYIYNMMCTYSALCYIYYLYIYIYICLCAVAGDQGRSVWWLCVRACAPSTHVVWWWTRMWYFSGKLQYQYPSHNPECNQVCN